MEARGRILIVDDEVNARTALAELLRDEGYSVETAADGFKALPRLDDFNPDVLLTDLKMPGMDGIALMRKSKEREPERAVIVKDIFVRIPVSPRKAIIASGPDLHEPHAALQQSARDQTFSPE